MTDWTVYPLRKCRSLHYCKICNAQILAGQKYRDGGADRRAHMRCVADENPNPGGNKMSTEIAKRVENPGIAKIRTGLEAVADDIQAAIPEVMRKYLTVERLIKLTTMQAGRDNKLLQSTTASILRAVIDAATLGLEIGSTVGHAYLVPYRNSATGRHEAHLIVGYQGYISLGHRTGELLDVETGIVRRGDKYTLTRGSRRELLHSPNLEIDMEDQDLWLFAYCVANFRGGGQTLTTVNRQEIEKIRKKSRARSGPWYDWPDQMWLKTAIRRDRKKWPFSPILSLAAQLENTAESGGHGHDLELDPVISRGLAAIPDGPPPDPSGALLVELQAQKSPPGPPDSPDWDDSSPADADYPIGSESAAEPPPEENPAPQSQPDAPPDTTGAPTGKQTVWDVLWETGQMLCLPDDEIGGILGENGVTKRTRSEAIRKRVTAMLHRAAGPEDPPPADRPKNGQQNIPETIPRDVRPSYVHIPDPEKSPCITQTYADQIINQAIDLRFAETHDDAVSIIAMCANKPGEKDLTTLTLEQVHAAMDRLMRLADNRQEMKTVRPVED